MVGKQPLFFRPFASAEASVLYSVLPLSASSSTPEAVQILIEVGGGKAVIYGGSRLYRSRPKPGIASSSEMLVTGIFAGRYGGACARETLSSAPSGLVGGLA